MLRCLVISIVLGSWGLGLNAEELIVDESVIDESGSIMEEASPANTIQTSDNQAGEMINIKTAFGTSFSAYAVGSKQAEYAVLLVPDRWGLSAAIKQQANRFASIGYHAVAVDLYDGRRVMDARMAEDVLAAIDPVWTEANLKGALEYLKDSHKKVLIMGWEVGADYALRFAMLVTDAIAATVLYYGNPTDDIEALRPISGPVLNIMAKTETKAALQSAASFQASMRALGKPLSIIEVDARRGFANSRSKSYDEAAADLAWQTTRDFLQKSFELESVN